MCGRYSITTPVEALARLFWFPERPNLAPRYNMAPTQIAPVVRESEDGRHLALLRWGLVPFWAKDAGIGARLINARAETLSEKPAFRDAFRKRRCILPADGFYEWQAAEGGKRPHLIRRRDGRPLAFAGLWESWRGGGGAEPLETFTIVTTDANETLRPIHERMPAILEEADFSLWLAATSDAARLRALLRPAGKDILEAIEVSTRVNNVRNDDAACAAPLAHTARLL
ncbi:MAG: SOS response-associated peptidase [Alphaproteobacteria bacterium]|nr:SOS response-associated peptidase [Alphaproteobacteria bacterium]